VSCLLCLNALAECTEDCTAEGDWLDTDKEVIFDGSRTRFEPGDAPPDDPTPSPVGRLRAHQHFWLYAMQSTGLVCSITLSIIRYGYRLPWNELGPAPPVHQPNHTSTLEHAAFITESVETGLRLGTWREVDKSALRCIMPLGVAIHTRTAKKRLIFDCRHLNRHLHTTKFKMESLHTEGRSLFQRGWFGGTIDLTSAYYHIEMHPSAHEYLGFEWQGRYYHYTVLPFGISTAPYIFTLVMKTPVAYMRSLGLRFIQYLDDLPFAGPTAAQSMADGARIISTLRSFGWLVHLAKCCGIEIALQVVEALGSIIDMLDGLYRTPHARIARVLALAHSLLETQQPLVKVVAQAKGLLGSMWLGMGEHSRIRTRALDKVIDSRLRPGDDPAARSTWRRRVNLSAQARDELTWWVANLERLDGRPIQDHWVDAVFDGTIATDASDTGFGGWVSLEGQTAAAHTPVLAQNLLQQAGPEFSVSAALRCAATGLEVWGPLPAELQGDRASSTLREICGAYLLLSMLATALSGGRFRLHFDNICCVMGLGGKVPPSATGGKAPKSVLGGSRVDEIQDYIIKILDLASEKDFQLVAIWVPRALNERSDLLSRLSAMARAEYCLSDACFAQVDRAWGRHSIDVFSVAENVRVESGRFMSKFYHERSVWIDSLSARWPASETIWAHPPPKLVGAAIQQFQASGAAGTLVVPLWRMASWWPILYPRGSRWGPAPFVKQIMRLGRARDVMSGLVDHPSSHFSSSMILAVRIDCRQAG